MVGTIVVSASIDVTAAGTIIATGFASLTESDGDETGCGVFLAPDTFDGGLANFFEPTAGAFLNGTVGTARHFDVSAGSHTVNLICRTTGGAGSSTSRSELSLLFLPS